MLLGRTLLHIKLECSITSFLGFKKSYLFFVVLILCVFMCEQWCMRVYEQDYICVCVLCAHVCLWSILILEDEVQYSALTFCCFSVRQVSYCTGRLVALRASCSTFPVLIGVTPSFTWILGILTVFVFAQQAVLSAKSSPHPPEQLLENSYSL